MLKRKRYLVIMNGGKQPQSKLTREKRVEQSNFTRVKSTVKRIISQILDTEKSDDSEYRQTPINLAID